MDQGAMREKFWKELTAEEQIERLRTQVKLVQERNVYLTQQLMMLKRHQHDVWDYVVVPIDTDDGYGYSERSNDEYF